jgi:hypothetical protein
VRLLSVYRECASVAANSTPTTWQTQPRDFSFSAADPDAWQGTNRARLQRRIRVRSSRSLDPRVFRHRFYLYAETYRRRSVPKTTPGRRTRSRNYKGDSSDHGSSQFSISAVIGGWLKQPRYLVGVTGFLGDGIDLAELPSDGIDPPLSTSMPPFSDGAGSAIAAWNAWSFVRPVLLA